MTLPKRKGFIQEVAEPIQQEFLQEIVEPEFQVPVEPELLQEDSEDEPVAKKKSSPKIGGRIQKAVNRAKTKIQSRK